MDTGVLPETNFFFGGVASLLVSPAKLGYGHVAMLRGCRRTVHLQYPTA